MHNVSTHARYCPGASVHVRCSARGRCKYLVIVEHAAPNASDWCHLSASGRRRVCQLMVKSGSRIISERNIDFFSRSRDEWDEWTVDLREVWIDLMIFRSKICVILTSGKPWEARDKRRYKLAVARRGAERGPREYENASLAYSRSFGEFASVASS